MFWNADTVFRILFDQLNLSKVLQLACGWGGTLNSVLIFVKK